MLNKVQRICVALPLLALATPVGATGFTVASVPDTVFVEGNRVFVTGDFINPDGCAVSSVAVMTPNTAEELNRMLSVALTALSSGKRLVMYFNGCVSVPWATSAPQAVSVRIVK